MLWSSPATDRLLLDARFARSEYRWGNSERDDNNRGLVRITGTPPFGGTSTTYRSQDWSDNHTALNTWHASAQYVTSSHVIRAGYQGLFANDDRTSNTNDQNLAYRLTNGQANQLTQVTGWSGVAEPSSSGPPQCDRYRGSASTTGVWPRRHSGCDRTKRR